MIDRGHQIDPQEQIQKDISAKLNALISIMLRLLLNDTELQSGKRRKAGASAQVHFLASFGLNPKDIASILGIPIQSARTLLTPKRRPK